MKELLKSLAGVAPVLATALGGPVGGVVARTALGALSGKLGLPKGKDGVKDVLGAIQADPEALAKVKQAELELSAKLKELDIDLEKIHASDRDSARKREIATGDKTPRIIAAAVILLLAGCLVGVFVMEFLGKEMSERGGTLLNVAIGHVSGFLSAVVMYYYGSSTAGDKAAAKGAEL